MDTDQELEVNFAAQGPREVENRRQRLDTADVLDTFRRFLAVSRRELRQHMEDLKRDPANEHRYQTLIERDHKAIMSMEDSIHKLLGEYR